MKKTAIISAAAIIVTTMTAPLASSSTAVVHENQTTNFIEDSRGANKDKFDGNTFTFTFDEPVKDENGFSERYFNSGSCSGTFADPRLEADGLIGYGLSVSCSGTGFLPLSAQITLQEEHLGTWYEDVDSPGIVPLTEGGYGFVRGEAYCNHDNSGHDYRVKAVIYAGNHTGRGRSREVHLPCNL